MRIIYLCAADPPSTYTDFHHVQKFFNALPEYIRPRTTSKHSSHALFFADRVGINWYPEFHDFAVVFLSQALLTNPTALLCLLKARTAFPNMIGIDLYDNLSPELMQKAHQYCKRIFSTCEGTEFLLTTFPEIAASFDLEEKELTKSIETDGYEYLDTTINHLTQRESCNRRISFYCYGLSFIILVTMLIFAFQRFYLYINADINFELSKTIVLCVGIIVLSALAISMCRFLFLLGKSFMVESIRCADRAHAIGLGRLYLKLFKGKFKWEELRDVLQSWNIDNGSAFINLDAKDIEGVNLDKLSSIINKN